MKDDKPILADVLDGLFHIAKADNVLHPKELAFLSEVARIFGFTEDEFAHIQARHVLNREENPYDVLGIAPEASNDDVKSRYRQLVKENHPDHLIARGVPPEFVSIATERLQAINEAYDQVERERGL
jgi:DnaJ like chaperone protein